MNSKVHILSDIESVASRAAEKFAISAREAVDARGSFTVALSGGSTPAHLYRILAQEPYASTLPWSQIHFFWGDERSVPPTSDQSNYRLAQEALLSKVPVTPEHVHPVPTELGEPHEVAKAYKVEIETVLGTSNSFDLILLGMGDDGHTASLFPGTAALQESSRTFVENHVPQLDTWRYTLTTPAILAAREVLLLVTGASKAPMIYKVFEGDTLTPLPVQIVNDRTQATTWLLDEAAAAQVLAG